MSKSVKAAVFEPQTGGSGRCREARASRVLFFAGGALLWSCSTQGQAPAPLPSQSAAATLDPSEVAARIGNDRVITHSDVDEHVRQMPEGSRAAFAKGEPRKRLVERLARTELLALAASERGMDKDPEVQRIYKQALVSALLRHEIDAKLGASDVPPVAVSDYLKQHPELIARPEQVRVGLIVVEDRATAERVAAKARALENGHGFAKLVARYSKDSSSKARAGELPFFAQDSTQHPKEIVEAAFTLKEPGDVAGPIEVAAGFAIFRLLEKRAGNQRTAEEARDVVEKRLREQLRAQRVEKLVKQLQQKYPVKIEEKNVPQR